ncbi:1-phosphofructokinase family hexose kinase [Shimia sp.]|uniref:1-phosphofructokinase family hexose kinase n=1 Tax=Shimia sp. TaxID=1954381 RepID=UPI00329A276F
MPDILTVTLNPCVDLATGISALEPGLKLRCSDPAFDPGGGGINVSRAIKLLGGRSAALVAIGGNNGARLLELLTQEGIATVGFQGPGETRQSLSVTSEADGGQYRFVLPGPSWSENDLRRALDTIDQATGRETLVVLSGSQPPGVAKNFPAILSGHVQDRRARLVVDTSGPALANLVEDPHESLHVLRMDAEEAEGLAGRALPSRADTAAFARSLVDRGIARYVLVSRGPDGSVLATSDGCWHAVSPRVKVVSAVGAGDSFVGGFTYALSRNDAPPECLRLAVATAASAVTTEATRLCDPDMVRDMMPQIDVTEI